MKVARLSVLKKLITIEIPPILYLHVYYISIVNKFTMEEM
ncbi:Glutamine--fructose-6-phosphate aminotransferase [Bacillus cereus Rock4-18]|nr:Glutamine--fructose-6-phosphate aminotransferase [Bacillus cereus Rock4-18]